MTVKVGIYNRHWNTLGGGEKYLGVMAQCLSERADVDLICTEEFSTEALDRRLKLDLGRCRTRIVSGETDAELEEVSAQYDLWINGTFVSTMRPRARRSIRVVFFPFLLFPVSYLWRAVPVRQPRWLMQLLWRHYGFWESYDVILAISAYTRQWTEQWWHAGSEILSPPVDEVGSGDTAKKKIILSVGRFFAHNHNKKQDVMVDAFREMYEGGACPGWEFHLCGGTEKGPAHEEYLAGVVAKAQGYPVFIHTDIGREELELLYREASIFWHATGFGEDERRRPELFEHFGITTVEAMSAGCIPVVIDRGGQREIVTHGENGYLWKDLGELKRFTQSVMEREDLEPLRTRAVEAAHRFCRQEFAGNLAGILGRHGMLSAPPVAGR